MNYLLLSFLFLSISLNIFLGVIVKRFSQRLLQFDDLMGYLSDDLETNINYFDKLTETPLVSNAPEIVAVHKNIITMSQRFDEFINRFSEQTGRDLRKTTRPKPPQFVSPIDEMR